MLLKTGNNIDQEEIKLTDLNKNDIARVLLSGKFSSINHKDLGYLMKEQTEQAKKTPSSGKQSEAETFKLPKHSADLYNYDQNFYRKCIRMFGHITRFNSFC